MMHLVKWTRRVGGKRALWRMKYELSQRLGSTSSRGLHWPSPAVFMDTEAWASSLLKTWPGQVAERVRHGEAARVLGKLYDAQARAELAGRTHALRVTGQWTLYEALPCSIGAPIEWLRHPDSRGHHWALEPGASVWRTAPHMGDIKDIWEVGRCGWLFDLIRQRACDGDTQTWSSMVAEQVARFEHQHTARYLGPHFASGQECAIRAVRLCMAAAVFMKDEGWAVHDTHRTQRVLYAHGLWIERHLDFARHAVPNNHVIAEALALWMLGECAPWWPECARWQALARRVLHQEIATQFSDDGGYCQASHTYHRAALEMLSWWWAMSPNDPESRALIAQLMARSSAHLHDWMMDDERGVLPNFGANDGAHFHAFSSADYEDFRPCLELLGHITHPGYGVFPEHAPSQESAYWLHGKDALVGSPRQRARPGVMHGNLNGLIGLRDGQWQVGMRVGPLWGTASQLDFGHVELWHEGVCVAGDRGSMRYHDAKVFEAHAGLHAHSLVCVDGARFAVERVGRFMLAARAWTHEHGAKPGRLWWLHDGWGRAVRGRYLRDVSVMDGVVLVRDQARMRTTSEGVLRWQLAQGASMVFDDPLCMMVKGVRVRVSVRGGQILESTLTSVTCARRYGAARPMSVWEVRFSVKAGDVCELVTRFEEASCTSC